MTVEPSNVKYTFTIFDTNGVRTTSYNTLDELLAAVRSFIQSNPCCKITMNKFTSEN